MCIISDKDENNPDSSININNNHGLGPLSVSPSIMAKYLEDELKQCHNIKHCDTCNCPNKELLLLSEHAKHFSVGTQTILHGDSNNALCLRCNSNLNSPSRTNSPYIMKLIKSSDSVISETKSSVSNSTQNGGVGHQTLPIKKDDLLMVNPILTHHRLCERTPLVPLSPLVGQTMTTTNTNTNTIGTTLIIGSTDASIIEIDGVSGVGGGLTNVSPIKVKDQQASSNGVVIDVIVDNRSNVSGEELDLDGNGSTNSLWSKTSSNTNTEGAKMFENFNLNLIKTIKVSLKKENV